MRWREWGRLSWRLEFKAQDFWVGCYWERRAGTMATGYHAWLCALPMVPLHLCLVRWKESSMTVADPLELAALARLDALERRATPGPWATDHEHTVAGEDETTLLCHVLCGGGWTRVEDADLIVALRNAAPALLRAARAAAEGKVDDRG